MCCVCCTERLMKSNMTQKMEDVVETSSSTNSQCAAQYEHEQEAPSIYLQRQCCPRPQQTLQTLEQMAFINEERPHDFSFFFTPFLRSASLQLEQQSTGLTPKIATPLR